MFVKMRGEAREVSRTINIRCPHCRRAGAFHGFNAVQDVTWHEIVENRIQAIYAAGLRQCPNTQCAKLVFVLLKGKDVEQTFPPEVIDFDATNLPPRILESLEEAIKAHSAGCFKASALMVRRVLEEVCRDKNANGENLKKRIAALGSSVVIPKELLDAADELRMLGNEAAHVEAKEYDAVGAQEAELAVELAKELLKAVYQYSSLVERLKALKRPPAAQTGS